MSHGFGVSSPVNFTGGAGSHIFFLLNIFFILVFTDTGNCGKRSQDGLISPQPCPRIQQADNASVRNTHARRRPCPVFLKSPRNTNSASK
ncbi:hypothetical protein NDU88_001538 [Pleurodeles waltl]|uniref:Uncharacterized protein n=1 Tax=Pleurodeles waltl TaxID=8319 RepID=A0AAV7L9S8_PLEWA|nr:hypothetical protein NDU88_001538 [Pleurodeles waltl]